MTTKEANALVAKIKYASHTDAVRIVMELEVKIKKPVYQWEVKKKKLGE